MEFEKSTTPDPLHSRKRRRITIGSSQSSKSYYERAVINHLNESIQLQALSLDILPFELLVLLMDFFTEKEKAVLQEVSQLFQSAVQQHAKFEHNGRLFSGALSICGIEQRAMPQERLDIWNSPTAPPQLLPQSVLHGRCGALLQITHGPDLEELGQARIKRCINCGFSTDASQPHEKVNNSVDPHLELARKQVESFEVNQKKKINSADIKQFGITSPLSGRLLLCGGYGMFELWDHNVPMRCNEMWEIGLQSQIWRLHGGMLEEELSDHCDDLRFEYRDSTSYEISGAVIRLIVFGLVSPTNSCYRVFNRVAVIDLGNYRNANDVPPVHNEAVRWVAPFNVTRDFSTPNSYYFKTEGAVPKQRECYGSCLFKPPTVLNSGSVVLFGGYTSGLHCLDGLYLLEIPPILSQRYVLRQPIGITLKWNLIHCTSELPSHTAPCARFGHSMTTIGNRIFLFGGKTQTHKSSCSRASSVFLADLWILQQHTTHQWRWQATLCNGTAPSPRTSHRSVCVGSHLIIFGGFAMNRYVNDFYVLSTASYTWTSLDFTPSLLQRVNSLNKQKRLKKENTSDSDNTLSSSSFSSSQTFSLRKKKRPNKSRPNTTKRKSTNAHPTKTKQTSFLPRSLLASQMDICTNCRGSTISECPKPLSHWISPRMESSMIFDGRNTLIIFGGSCRFRWDCKQLRFKDFFSDLYHLNLDVQ